MLAVTCPDVTPAHSPLSYPDPILARSALDDTHTVATLPVSPTRDRLLSDVVPVLATTTVTLAAPVVGPFRPTRLLAARDTPPKLKLSVDVSRRLPDVAATHTPDSYPPDTLPRNADDETHTDAAAPVRPTRARSVLAAEDDDDASRVTLVPPVVAAFRTTTLLRPTAR